MTSLNLAQTQVASGGLTIATTAYTDGDVLGTLMTFVMGSASGMIVGAELVDAGNVIGAVDAFIYDRNVTLAANNAADSISDADALFKLGVLSFPYPTTQTLNRTSHIDSIAFPYIANGSSTIYVALVTRSNNAVFAAVTDLNLKLIYSKDV